MEPSRNQVGEMFNTISPSYDRINRILSLGRDASWRRKMIDHLPYKEGLHLLDLATGTGDQLYTIMDRCPYIERGIGLDIAEEMLKIGKDKLEKKPYKERVLMALGSAMEIPLEDNSVDVVTISFGVRNFLDLDKGLKEMLRVLKPGGKVLILEFSLPRRALTKSMHLLYIRHLLPRIGGLLSKDKEAYTYLNKTIETFPYGPKFCKLLREIGYQTVSMHPMMMGAVTLYVGEKSV